MKFKFTYLLGLLFLVACSSNSENEGDSYEKLPEGKWNGEYMEVESEDDKDKKRPTKKSNGGEILNLGKVVYTIDEKEEKIIHFDKRKNDITINKDQIVIRIKDANERMFLISIHKDEIYKNPKDKYVYAASENKESNPKFTLSYLEDSDYMKHNFQCTEGTLEVKKMNLKTGEVLIKSRGKLQTLEDLQKGTTKPFELEVQMYFETVVSAFNPNK